MSWYGSYKYPTKNLIISQKSKLKNKLKTSAYFLRSRTNLNFSKIFLYIPSKWNFLIFKKSQSKYNVQCYFYSSTYYFVIPLKTSFTNVAYDFNTRSIQFLFNFKNNFMPLFWKLIKTLLHSFTRIFFRKLRFRGKGYYIYKNNRNTIAIQAGYSHIMRLYAFFTSVKFVTKTTILLFGINKISVTTSGVNLFNLKPVNVFTGKGMRFSRQILYRKTGKISTYR